MANLDSAMELNFYQNQRDTYTTYKKVNYSDGLTYTILALCGESGELANKLKKHLRAGTKPDREVLMDELGDVLWYTAAVADELGYTLQEVAEFNLSKLEKRRQERSKVG